MKRIKEKVPEFDDIIFENRNKKYGAYDLRKRYNSTTGISILAGVATVAIFTVLISLNTEEGAASSPPTFVVIEISNPVIPDPLVPQALKPPEEFTNAIKNLAPEVVPDSSQLIEFIPITDDIIDAIKDGDIATDKVEVIETPEPIIPTEIKPFIVVEEPPQYPGGPEALLRFIGENLNYPDEAQKNNIQGKVILKFVVNADGSTDRIEILRSIDPSLDNEAVRVIRKLPRFRPGKQGGVPVPVWFTIPVTFKLEER